MRYTYRGDQAATYPQYLDVGGDQPATLVAEPGQTYAIEPATGHTVLNERGERVPLELPMPPDERWAAEAKPARAEAKSKES